MRSTTAALVVGMVLLAGVSPAGAVVNPPVLKWQGGGCTGGFCQTGWYSSPAVADLDGDGQNEVIYGAYDVVVLNGQTGAVRARGTNGSRVWPGVAIADLNNDGVKEIIVGRDSNQVTVYHFNPPSTTLSVVWTRNPFTRFCSGNNCEVRTLAVADLEADGQLEVIVGRASGGADEQIQVFDANGNVRSGFPARHQGDQGFGWGMYNENITVGDLNGDGFKEIYGPTDTHYITAVDRFGNGLPTNAMFNDVDSNPPIPHPWARVGVHVDLAADIEGFAECGVQHRPNFANSAPAIADVNGDGVKELIVVGDVYNCDIGDPDGDLYHLPWILKMDRSRWTGSGFDWTVIPTAEPNSGPLSQDFDVIQNDVQNAVVADLDNDGRKEILYPSYDGRLHAYWLDKTEHGSWPYAVPGNGGGIHFASEPIVADIDGDGQAEVIFTSWPQEGSGQVGKLHILSSQGVPLQTVNLPAPFGGANINGGLAAPTLANIDADADLEIVVGTMSSGAVAYDLPGSANARVLWGTGRGSYRRTGEALSDVSDLAITKTDGQATATPGMSVTYTIVASNTSGGAVTGATVADTFPGTITGVTWSCVASSGSSCGAASGTGNINRTVNLLAGGTVTFTATGTIAGAATGVLTNTATVTAPSGVTDSDPSDNVASDTDTLVPPADLSVTKTDGQTTAAPGQALTYTMVVTNSGPNSVTGATVSDSLPPGLTSAAWTCTATLGSCTSSGTGSILDTVNLTAGGTLTYTLNAAVAPSPASIRNTITVAVPSSMVDPNLANNSATDDDLLTCAAYVVLSPDGRETTATVAGGGTGWFIATLDIGASYVLQAENSQANVPPVVTVYRGDEGCTNSPAAVQDITAVDPRTTAAARVSFTASGNAPLYRFKVENGTASPVTYRLRLSETTLFSAAWSTNSTYDTYYSFQNTTSATLHGNLLLADTAGAPVSSLAVTLLPGRTATANTQALGTSRNRTGTARFAHDGPAGSVLAAAAIANFSLPKPYVQTLKFTAAREER